MTRRELFKRVFGGVAAAALAPLLPKASHTGKWVFQPKYYGPITIHVTDEPEYLFGFSGFKEGDDIGKIAGQLVFKGYCHTEAPRLSRVLYGEVD